VTLLLLNTSLFSDFSVDASRLEKSSHRIVPLQSPHHFKDCLPSPLELFRSWSSLCCFSLQRPHTLGIRHDPWIWTVFFLTLSAPSPQAHSSPLQQSRFLPTPPPEYAPHDRFPGYYMAHLMVTPSRPKANCILSWMDTGLQSLFSSRSISSHFFRLAESSPLISSPRLTGFDFLPPACSSFYKTPGPWFLRLVRRTKRDTCTTFFKRIPFLNLPPRVSFSDFFLFFFFSRRAAVISAKDTDDVRRACPGPFFDQDFSPPYLVRDLLFGNWISSGPI